LTKIFAVLGELVHFEANRKPFEENLAIFGVNHLPLDPESVRSGSNGKYFGHSINILTFLQAAGGD